MINKIFIAPTVLFLFVFSLAGYYLYKNVLPYQFPNQWNAFENELNVTGEYDYTEEKGEFLGMSVESSDVSSMDIYLSDSSVLGDTDSSDKRIEVDLTNQMVYAFEGDSKVMEFLVSTGKWGRTPTGEFTIEYKTLAQKMSGGSRALGTYYYLPNVQFVQYFGNKQIPWGRGFSFHGTYWHNNFGHPMSHGCINMTNDDAKKLFEWTMPSLRGNRIARANKDIPGTKVTIYGVTPK